MKSSSGLAYEVLNAILCEDARKDKSEKDILVGVFSGNIFVSKFPANVPLVVWLNVKVRGVGKDSLEVKLTSPSSKKPLTGTFLLEKKESDTYDTLSVATPTAMVSMEKPGDLKFQIKQSNGRWKTLISKKVLPAPEGTFAE